MHVGYLGPSILCFSSWVCPGCSVQGGLIGGVLSPFWVSSGLTIEVAMWLLYGCSILFFFFFYWYDRQYFLFSAGKSYYSTLIMSLPCIFLFWLIKKFNIFICHPIAFWLLLFLMRSQLFIVWGFFCMQITFFLLPKILSLAFSITILCLSVALSVLFSYLQFVELLRYVC